MNVVEYDPRYKDAFIKFNTDWIVDNFGKLEENDLEAFQHIEEYLAKGAMIYFAVEDDDTPLGCCMVKPLENGTWEICKLGSNKEKPHKGVGSAVIEPCMKWAIDHGAKRLFILTNSSLKAAIHVYEKHGFREIKLDDYQYERGDIAFECMVES